MVCSKTVISTLSRESRWQLPDLGGSLRGMPLEQPAKGNGSDLPTESAADARSQANHCRRGQPSRHGHQQQKELTLKTPRLKGRCEELGACVYNYANPCCK
jgi:hypothetical protein